jgi:hypothetical protein
MPHKVVVVLLRQPRMNVVTEKRSDPFWEFGSFGTTGCHQRNLMHPKRAAELNGARLAFVQGGSGGFRLVHLTGPVDVVTYADRSEVRWEPSVMPFRYKTAPLIVDKNGDSDVLSLVTMIRDVNRNGWQGRFASKFRSRRQPLPDAIAGDIIKLYRQRLRSAATQADVLASTYEQALPVNPPCLDRHRRRTYAHLVAEAASK